ncbi:hypothetical protein MSTE_04173 [Mycobacteroides stephanolepidis]|uniref:Uncharacterized protein n=1 Tax=[Mycobacterium] stephanolepidis TaxID=1520670 RepID=A0A1Z4F2P5_9MYCO|nr:hypothetical protein MSTE_04173 [[Mycobacterium] stephanolepidis]
MDAVYFEDLREFGAIERAHVLTGDRTPEAGKEPAITHRVIRGFPVIAPDRRGGESPLHQFVVEKFLRGGGDRGQRRQPRLVGQDITHRDRLFAVGGEFRPVAGDRGVVGQQPSVGQTMDNGGGHPFGGRVHDRRGIAGPRHTGTRLTGPDVEHGFAVDIGAERATPGTADIHRRELADHPGELGLCPALHAVR